MAQSSLKTKLSDNHVPATSKKFKVDDEKERILKLIENDVEGDKFDEHALRKLIIQLEKKYKKNQEMRTKYPEDPFKFMDSELELNDTIQEMHVAATRPDLYHLLLQANSIQILLGLLSHENTDISASVINLLQELTDVDSFNESVEGATLLIDALCEQQIISLLIPNLERFDENKKDEADGVYNALEFKPSVCTDAAKQGLLQWLLKRIKVKGQFDANKSYSAEILSILVQNNDENRKVLGELEGIDILLQQLAYYKKHDPSGSEELEYMENLFNSLCSSLMLPANRVKFLKGEGLQLMRLMLREQKESRNSALKILTYAMNDHEGKANCQTFVDILGLGVLFPLFMKPPKGSKKTGETRTKNEEYIVSIIASLLKNCTGAQKQRVLGKFTENDHEKVDRLMEIYIRNLERVNAINNEIQKERDENDEIDDDMEVEFYMRRLDAGLFTLQLTVYIILEISANGEPSIKNEIQRLLKLRNLSVKTIKDIAQEYMENMSDDEETLEIIKEEREKITEYLQKF